MSLAPRQAVAYRVGAIRTPEVFMSRPRSAGQRPDASERADRNVGPLTGAILFRVPA